MILNKHSYKFMFFLSAIAIKSLKELEMIDKM